MTPLLFTLATFVISGGAGFIGSLLGLGGGIIVIPALVLLLHIDIRYAIGASIVSVIATSSGAAAAYVREGLSNLRVAMFLEIGTTTGALTGAFLAGIVGGRWLYLAFASALVASVVGMLRSSSKPELRTDSDPLSDRLRLHGSYFESEIGALRQYQVARPLQGLGMMYVAGVMSGLLGIGSGALKVAAMDLTMRLPLKVSTATSNLMIGVTAAASAGIYFARGDIDPFVAAPVATGVALGALLGSRALPRFGRRWLRLLFVVVLLWVAAQMFLRGLR